MENKLKLNDDQTEILLCGPPSLQEEALTDHVLVSNISQSASIMDLGLVTDANLNMTAPISNVTMSCYCQLRSLGKLRRFITQRQQMPL